MVKIELSGTIIKEYRGFNYGAEGELWVSPSADTKKQFFKKWIDKICRYHKHYYFDFLTLGYIRNVNEHARISSYGSHKFGSWSSEDICSFQ